MGGIKCKENTSKEWCAADSGCWIYQCDQGKHDENSYMGW